MNQLIVIVLISLFYSTIYSAEEVAKNPYCRSDCKYEFSFFKKYSHKGSKFADLAVSVMYYSGFGTKIDIVKGRRHLLRAARSREQGAQFQLGYFLMHGMYMKRDLQAALKWFKLAERSGFKDATDYIALLEKNNLSFEPIINLSGEQKTTSDISKVNALSNAEKISNEEQNQEYIILTIYSHYTYESVFPIVVRQACSFNCGLIYPHARLPLIYLESDKFIKRKRLQ